MSSAWLHLIPPEVMADFVQRGCLHSVLAGIARLAGADLTVGDPVRSDTASPPSRPNAVVSPIRYREQARGWMLHSPDGNGSSVAGAASAIVSMLDHLLEREMAVGDLANAMIDSYGELNVIHSLLAEIACRTDARDIGEVLVGEVARTLDCRRVSLLVLDGTRQALRVLAARGLPEEAYNVSIPIAGSVAGRALQGDGVLVIDDISNHPDLASLSRGDYQTESFAAIRVPLNARGEVIGVLVATDRTGPPEFTARDCTLLKGMASIGASALLNCRFHAAVNEQMMSTISALASAVDAKDQYTHDHSARVAELSVAAARLMGVSEAAAAREVQLAGLLHDIGKIGVPDSILSKPGRLTPEEFHIAQTHVHTGAKIVEQVRGLETVAKAILHHHERYDGLGYPSGLCGEAIPLSSRLISATDAFDTLTSDRPYRKRIPTEDAIAELRRSKGTQQDPMVVEALIAVLSQEMGGGGVTKVPARQGLT